MYITMDGHRLTGDEVEVDDNATLKNAWLVEVFSDKHDLKGRAVITQTGYPTEDMQLYWLFRYEGQYIKLTRIKILDYDLPFGNLSDYGEAHFINNEEEL